VDVVYLLAKTGRKPSKDISHGNTFWKISPAIVLFTLPQKRAESPKGK